MSRAAQSASARLDRRYAGRFTAFTDYLLLGAMVVVASVPVVTWFAAFTAGCWLARDREALDATVGPRGYGVRLRTVLRSGAAVVLVPSLALVVVAVDVLALHAGLGASGATTTAIVVAVLALGLVTMRAAASYAPGDPWGAVVRDAVVAVRTDPGGSALLAGVLLAALAVAAWVPPVVVVLPGPLCLAAAAVVARRRAVLPSASDRIATAPR